MRMFVAAAIALTTSSAWAQEADQAAALARASQRGTLLYAYDQAAWHGTDDMLEKLKDPASKIGGYVVTGPVEAPRLVFFDKAARAAVYVAKFERTRLVDGRVLRDGDDDSLSAIDLRMIAALNAARSAIASDGRVRACAPRPFNTVVLPPETPSGDISVYFLTPRTTNEAVPFGGHFEVKVDAENKPREVRHFTNSCVDVPVQTKLKNDTKPEALFVTHLLDRVPTEIHVFNSLSVQTPLLVGITSTKMLWPVRGSHIGEPIPLANNP
jgi:hypothetical protein